MSNLKPSKMKTKIVDHNIKKKNLKEKYSEKEMFALITSLFLSIELSIAASYKIIDSVLKTISFFALQNILPVHIYLLDNEDLS